LRLCRRANEQQHSYRDDRDRFFIAAATSPSARFLPARRFTSTAAHRRRASARRAREPVAERPSRLAATRTGHAAESRPVAEVKRFSWIAPRLGALPEELARLDWRLHGLVGDARRAA